MKIIVFFLILIFMSAVLCLNGSAQLEPNIGLGLRISMSPIAKKSTAVTGDTRVTIAGNTRVTIGTDTRTIP